MAKTTKPPKDPNALTKTQALLREQIERAGGVFFSRTSEAGCEGGTWYFIGAQGSPSPSVLQCLIRKGALIPKSDGLFPGESQTFVVPAAPRAMLDVGRK